MNRLVQLSIKNWLDLQGTKVRWQGEALELLAERFPSGLYETWNECEVLSPHAQVVIEYKRTTESHSLQYAKLLHKLAVYDEEQGQYNISCRRFSQSLYICKTELGKKHPDTLTSMGSLAEVLDSQGKYKKAEAMHRQTLELSKTVLGKKHPDMLITINNLVNVLRSQGKYGKHLV